MPSKAAARQRVMDAEWGGSGQVQASLLLTQEQPGPVLVGASGSGAMVIVI